MNPIHAPEDETKVAAIAASLARHGWVGSPLVAWDDNLLTGAHRYAAARALDWTDAEIPTIDIRDIFTACGLDFGSLAEEEGIDGIDHPELPWFLTHYLPADTRELFGIDLR